MVWGGTPVGSWCRAQYFCIFDSQCRLAISRMNISVLMCKKVSRRSTPAYPGVAENAFSILPGSIRACRAANLQLKLITSLDSLTASDPAAEVDVIIFISAASRSYITARDCSRAAWVMSSGSSVCDAVAFESLDPESTF